MRENGHVTCHHDFEKEVLQLGRRRVMRRLYQDVARIGQRQQAARAKSGNEIRAYVNVRAGGQSKRDFFLIENFLEPRGSQPNLRTGVMV
jgi:hypothetical protein